VSGKLSITSIGRHIALYFSEETGSAYSSLPSALALPDSHFPMSINLSTCAPFDPQLL